MVKRRKRRLKKSVKIVIFLIFAVVAMSTSAYVYKTVINPPPVKPEYGKVGDATANENYGKVSDPDGSQKSVGDILTYKTFKLKDGYSIFVDYGDTEILIDAGANAKEGAYIAKSIRNDVMEELDYVIATNSTKERIGGMPEIYKNYRVKTTLHGKKFDTAAYKAFEKASEKSKVEKAKNNNIKLGHAATFSVYNLNNDAKTETDASLTTLLNYNNYHIATIGDVSEKYEARVTDKVSEANMLIVNQVNSPNFIKVVKPAFLIVSAKENIPKETIAAVQEYTEIYSLKKHGDIVVKYNGEEAKTNFESKENIKVE